MTTASKIIYTSSEVSLNNHTIWIAFLLKTDSIPTKILQLEGSVIVRTPAASENKKATWKWLKYPKLESRIPDKEKAFIEACQFREQLNNNVMRYLLSSDKLFKKDYSKWALWMKKNKLFEATPSQRNPKLPRCLVHHKELLCLWVFDSWYILTLSYLAEIIDSKPKGTMIYYCDIFDELSMRLPLHPNFSQLEQSLSSIVKTPEEKSTIIKEHIIEEALMPFRESAQVICLNGGFQRLENLLLSISFK
ncbi:hypothetical protein [Aliivibrio logei]|uniref:hypothetical protein n=1 Tax=Aliivibrio logei TaxID=688 RepID=UPI000B17DDEB|nr:hypothetical protein [Aliivibrio logei]